MLTVYEVTFPTSIGGPYTPDAVPTYTLKPATPVLVVGGSQMSDAVVLLLVDVVVVNELVVVDEPIVNVTGTDTLPPL